MKSTSKSTKATPTEIKIGVRRTTRDKFDAFAFRRRLKLVEVADIAIDALESLSKEQQDALIDRDPAASAG
jgi:hypothetical protein